MSIRLDLPWGFVLTTAALQSVGAKLYVYENNSTTPVDLFSDRACTLTAANPIVSVNGHFPVRFIATAELLTLELTTTAGAPLLSSDDIEPYSGSTGGGDTITGTSPAQTFRESDQALPAGLWRWRASGGGFALERNTAVAGDFSSFSEELRFGATGIGDFETTPTKDGVDIMCAHPGMVQAYAGTAAPERWLLCYGQAISRTTYAALFAIVSTTYGVGDGSTTFNVPDLRGRVVAGQDDMGGVSANRLTGASGGVDGDVLGGAGGAETHTLITAEIPAHTHTEFKASGTAVGGIDASGVIGENVASGSTGGGGAHNNVQPTLILNYIIYAGV